LLRHYEDVGYKIPDEVLDAVKYRMGLHGMTPAIDFIGKLDPKKRRKKKGPPGWEMQYDIERVALRINGKEVTLSPSVSRWIRGLAFQKQQQCDLALPCDFYQQLGIQPESLQKALRRDLTKQGLGEATRHVVIRRRKEYRLGDVQILGDWLSAPEAERAENAKAARGQRVVRQREEVEKED